MILYHGSGTIVAEPAIRNSNKICDFGPGFYTTDNEVKAWERAQYVIRHGDDFLEEGNLCYVSEYEIDLTDKNLKIKRYPEPNIEWLDQIISCHNRTPVKGYDVIIGPVADAKTKEIIIGYLSLLQTLQSLGYKDFGKEITALKTDTIAKLLPHKTYSQYVMISQKAFEKLEYRKSYVFSDKGPLLQTIYKGGSIDIQRLQKASKSMRKERWKGFER